MTELTEALRRIRSERPLVHCVSNIVTANDCANLLLAVGASPMMAQAPEEMADIAAISSAAVLNLGTPDAERYELCARRGKLANELGQPCVLDPVGAGASAWRLANIEKMLRQFTPAIVRVNLSEARALLGEAARERGVDSASDADEAARAECAAALARKLNAAVLLSGKADHISDGTRNSRVEGGSDWIPMVTGSGCMLSALCGAFAAVEPDAMRAAVLASNFWKQCAAQAERETQNRGPGTFHIELINAAHRTSLN